MKRYNLKCLNHECGEVGEVWAKVGDPMTLQCGSCQEEFDEDTVKEYVESAKSWEEYLNAYKDMISKEVEGQ